MALAFVHQKINRLEIQEEIDFSLSSKEKEEARVRDEGSRERNERKIPRTFSLGLLNSQILSPAIQNESG